MDFRSQSNNLPRAYVAFSLKLDFSMAKLILPRNLVVLSVVPQAKFSLASLS